jgi:hypothetical protein
METNLDLAAAVAASDLGREFERTKTKKQEVESLVNSALAVLARNGPYALFLYLPSRSDRMAEPLAGKLYGLVHRELALGGQPDARHSERLRELAKLAENLDRLLVARKLLNQTLTYVRYHAKCLPDRKNEPASHADAKGAQR